MFSEVSQAKWREPTQTCSSLTSPRPVPDYLTLYGYQTFYEDKLGEEEMSRTVQLKFEEKESENFKFARCQVKEKHKQQQENNHPISFRPKNINV